MTRTPTILVTGFGPYPRVRVNPTGALARRLAASGRPRRLGFTLMAQVLETSYAAAGAAIGPILAQVAPDACLHLGLAPRARALRVELRGENRTRALAVDVRGARPRSRALVDDGPAALRIAAPAARIRATLARGRLPVTLSSDAGAYLCNAVYFWSLSSAAADAPARPVVFVHIPWPAPPAGRLPTARMRRRRPTTAAMEAALMDVLVLLAREARGRNLPMHTDGLGCRG
jgi:pyroglutamyl-peptidase